MDIAELHKLFVKHQTITTDTRDCPENSIFLALKGETFNGNAFASAALDKGCAYAVVDEAEYAKAGDARYILVDDCLKTLQQLAHYHREQFSIPVIEITGTNGKTTTKELVSAVLSTEYNVLFTQGNLNNHIGVPKTLLRLTAEHQIAVVETGANHPGEIKTLAEIVDADYGLITNVGKAHLEGFGSFEGVIRTIGELYDYLRTKNGKSFINRDNEHLVRIASGLEHIEYGKTDGAGIVGELLDCSPFLSFRWREGDSEWNNVTTHLIGSYNIDNALSAVAVGREFGVSAGNINAALENYVPTNNRSQLVKTADNTLIVDAYNANPTSMMAALENFKQMNAENKMLIIGDMKELGEASVAEHEKIVNFVSTMSLKDVWLVGSEFAKVSHQYRTFDNIEEITEYINKCKPTGCTILIKGSNGTKLFKLPDLL